MSTLTREETFASLWERANKAGLEAAAPIPDAGSVGFGWIVLDGRSRFTQWAKRAGLARKNYPKGYRISSPVPKQSIDANEAWAKAAAACLNEVGIGAIARSRMD